MMIELIIEALGWAGAALILASYILLSNGRLQGQSPVYQWMNVGGSMGLVLNSGWNGAIPSVALNIVWMAMGLLTLWRIRTVR
jgi:hypothetical protein